MQDLEDPVAETKTELRQREGYAAHFAGSAPTDNPYPWSQQDECLAWIRGYNMARTDHAIANRAKADGKL